MSTPSENEAEHYRFKLKNIIEKTQEIHDALTEKSELPSWIQDKIALSEHNMEAICEFLGSELSEEELCDAYEVLEKHGHKHDIYESERENDQLSEAEYQGRNVELGKVMRGDVKKFKVYVKNPEGRVVKVNFGQKGMKIKKNNPERRKSFRARHNCDDPGPRHKARYWACKSW